MTLLLYACWGLNPPLFVFLSLLPALLQGEILTGLGFANTSISRSLWTGFYGFIWTLFCSVSLSLLTRLSPLITPIYCSDRQR